jgi:hypothetical protein
LLWWPGEPELPPALGAWWWFGPEAEYRSGGPSRRAIEHKPQQDPRRRDDGDVYMRGMRSCADPSVCVEAVEMP